MFMFMFMYKGSACTRLVLPNVLRGEVYPTPFDCPLRFWAVVRAPLYRAVRTRYKTTPSLRTERGGARAGMKADAHRRQRTLSSFSRLDPLWVRNSFFSGSQPNVSQVVERYDDVQWTLAVFVFFSHVVGAFGGCIFCS